MTLEHSHLSVQGISRGNDFSLNDNQEQLHHNTFTYRNAKKSGQIAIATIDNTYHIDERITPWTDCISNSNQYNSLVTPSTLQDAPTIEILLQKSCDINKKQQERLNSLETQLQRVNDLIAHLLVSSNSSTIASSKRPPLQHNLQFWFLWSQNLPGTCSHFKNKRPRQLILYCHY